MNLIQSAISLINRFSQEIRIYRLVLKHPRTPRLAQVLLGAAIAYAVSPIDLIPDFIPVVGHLDDVIVLPVLIWLALRLIPTDVIAECKLQQLHTANKRFQTTTHNVSLEMASPSLHSLSLGPLWVVSEP